MEIPELPQRYTHTTAFLEKDAQPDRVNYHFTSRVGRDGILGSRQLWLTQCRHLSDTTEVTYAIALVEEIIINTIMPKTDKLFFKKVFANIKNFVNQKLDFYVTSFCEKVDVNHPWTEYADQAQGFALGFKPSFFQGSSLLQAGNAPTFGRIKVYYSVTDDLAQCIKDLVMIVRQDLKKNISQNIIAAWLSATLLPVLISFKHPSLVDDRERRIFHSSDTSVLTQKFKTPHDPLVFPHVSEIKRIFHQFSLEHLTELWVGSRLDFQEEKQNIEMLLEKLSSEGLDTSHIQILRSEIPYKNLEQKKILHPV
jgi:hypothetical protein